MKLFFLFPLLCDTILKIFKKGSRNRSHSQGVKAEMKKKEKWLKFRHRVVRNLAMAVLKPYSRWKYGIRVEKFKEQGDRPYLILYNHQTAFDQFFVGMAFSGPVYYLASEDLFSKGWVSGLIRYLVAPIPIKKQATDVAAVMNCMRVAREGGTIAIAPEGNRTYSGKTEYMNPAIAPLAKRLKLPIALYRIEGGYGVHPRWSDVLRKGKMRSYVSQVIEPEEVASLPEAELLERIRKGLSVDEGKDDGLFRSGKRAEYLERAIYVCPDCGLAEFESHGNIITCKGCGLEVSYGENKSLQGVRKAFPFDFVTAWYEYQCDFVNRLDPAQYEKEPAFRDRGSVFEVLIQKKKLLRYPEARLALYGDRITINEGEENSLCLPFSELSAVAVLGRNKVNLYYKKQVYQIKASKRFNGLKYVNFYYRYKNVMGGNADGKFLGL